MKKRDKKETIHIMKIRGGLAIMVKYMRQEAKNTPWKTVWRRLIIHKGSS